EPAVGDSLVVVDRDCLRDVPALPTGLAGAVGEVDLLDVEPVALVEAAKLLEHLASEEEESAEQPIRGGRVGRVLVEQVVAALAPSRRQHAAQRRAAAAGAADGR